MPGLLGRDLVLAPRCFKLSQPCLVRCSRPFVHSFFPFLIKLFCQFCSLISLVPVWFFLPSFFYIQGCMHKANFTHVTKLPKHPSMLHLTRKLLLGQVSSSTLDLFLVNYFLNLTLVYFNPDCRDYDVYSLISFSLEQFQQILISLIFVNVLKLTGNTLANS